MPARSAIGDAKTDADFFSWTFPTASDVKSLLAAVNDYLKYGGPSEDNRAAFKRIIAKLSAG